MVRLYDVVRYDVIDANSCDVIDDVQYTAFTKHVTKYMLYF